MALFTEALTQEITALVQKRYQELGVLLGGSPSGEHPAQLDEQGPLQQSLTLLIQIANGEYSRTAVSSDMLSQVKDSLKLLLDVLLGNVLHSSAMFPDDFWQTDIGVLVSRVRWWLSGDELITISNAAALAFGENTQANRMRIARAIDNGYLEWVPDPSVTNPQQNKRVLRPQVERLRDLRCLPE
jgi:hypothetical protein